MSHRGDVRAGGPEGEAMPRNREYGCLFCVTGREQEVVTRIEMYCSDVRAMAARRETYKTNKGQKHRVEEVFLPSYVFFEAEEGFDPFRDLPKEQVIRILTLESGYWQLRGEDLRFAQWLFQYDGLLSFSTAYKEGERIRIADGPLKDMEGYICKLDKRGRSGQISLEFNGRVIKLWLGFDLIDPVGPVARGNV